MVNKKRIVNDIIDRLKTFFELKSDAELAKKLQVTPGALSNWRSRGSLDYASVLTHCDNINLNWLLTGKGMMNLDGPAGEIHQEELDMLRMIKGGNSFEDVMKAFKIYEKVLDNQEHEGHKTKHILSNDAARVIEELESKIKTQEITITSLNAQIKNNEVYQETIKDALAAQKQTLELLTQSNESLRKELENKSRELEKLKEK